MRAFLRACVGLALMARATFLGVELANVQDGDVSMLRRLAFMVLARLYDADAVGRVAVDDDLASLTISAGVVACVEVVDASTGAPIDDGGPRCGPVEAARHLEYGWDYPAGNYTVYAWVGADDRPKELPGLSLRVARGPLPEAKVVLGLFLGHDACAALTVDGLVQMALELERLFEERFWGADCADPHLEEKVGGAVALVRKKYTLDHVAWVPTVVPDGCVRRFRDAVTLGNGGVTPVWVEVDHHVSHATLALHDAPFRRPLILSLDGGGNDGFGFIFTTTENGDLFPLEKLTYNLGGSYAKLGVLMTEVSGGVDAFRDRCGNKDYGAILRCALGLAGKVMGYSGLGTARPEWLEFARDFMLRSDAWIRITSPDFLEEPWLARNRSTAEDWARALARDDVYGYLATRPGDDDATLDRDWAATAQRAFELEVRALLEPYLLQLPPHGFDGILMTGGCALNVIANSYLEKLFALPVYAPSAPNDGGLGVGAAWQVAPPPRHQYLQYAGPPLFDGGDRDDLVTRFAIAMDAAGERVFASPLDGSVEPLARALADGWVVGVARERMEFGPRALGHRSLLAAPFDGAEDAMNAIKFREWWRPVAPMVAAEDALRVFTTLPRRRRRCRPSSTTTAPRGRRSSTGTRRPGSTRSSCASRSSRAGPCSSTRPSNTRGKPILSTVAEALALLRDSPAMNAAVVDDLFVTLPQRPRVLKKRRDVGGAAQGELRR